MATTRRAVVFSGLLAACLVVSACEFEGVGTPPSYDVSAEFPSAIGLYPGSYVRQLGIDIGSVVKTSNQGDHVLVTMRVDNTDKLSATADAILVGDSVLGERYVQFEPAYTGGATMAAGTVLPESRVTVPVEIDTVLRSLNTVLSGIEPTNVTAFTTNLAAVLNNQGANLNELIHNAAGTITLLADKSQDLGQLTTTLAALTGQLDTRDQALASLITDYDLLSETLAGDQGQLNGVITQLTNVTTEGTDLLAPDLQPIQTDVADLTTVGQTLDRNINAINIGLQYAPRLFAGAEHAYDPEHNWLPLNSQTPLGLTSAVLVGNVRDALASLCRRLAVREPALATQLATCGNPASSFFNPILGLIPTVVGSIPGEGPQPAPVPPAASRNGTPADAPADATEAFARGLAAIPGLSAAELKELDDPRWGATTPAPSAAPLGEAAVAALAAVPRGTVPSVAEGASPWGTPASLGPAPILHAAPAARPGLLHQLFHWVVSLW